ncbi:MAG: acyl-CoA dehydrogenase family protein [Novosphingobium sp.]
MNFDYTDDQKALKDEARRFLADVAPLSAARGVLDDRQQSHDASLWARIGEQGWCGAAIPEKYGGLGLGYVELCALAEELGRAVAPVPFASSVYLFAEALLVAGTEVQKSEWLPKVSTGELIGTLAVSEGPGVLWGERIKTWFENGALTGVKLPVTDGMTADRAVVLANSDEGLGLYLVDFAGPGVTREVVSTLDPTRGAARITFANAPAMLLLPGDGPEQLARIHDRAAILLAFEALGGADRALEMARDYALERYAFGRQIGSYQAIKHKLADVFVRNEVARANAYYGAWALASDAPELALAAAAARVSSSAAYYLAARENIQTYGGIGFTWEADCHFFYRRARHLSLILGAPRVWKRHLADRLVSRLAAEDHVFAEETP